MKCWWCVHRVKFFSVASWLLVIVRQYLITKLKTKPKGMKDFDWKSGILLQVTMSDCFENFSDIIRHSDY